MERAEGERDVDTPIQVCVEALVVRGEVLYHNISPWFSSFPSPSHYLFIHSFASLEVRVDTYGKWVFSSDVRTCESAIAHFVPV